MLGHDVLRRPRALRLHERGVRAVRARERAAARHVPERDEVRGRDHRDDARPAARRRGHRRRAGRARHLGRHAAASSTRCSPTASTRAQTRGIDAPERRQARDRAPRVRQGVPPASASSCGSAPVDPDDHAGRRRRGRASSSTTNTIAIDRLGLQLRLRHDRPDRRARPSSRSSAASACTSTAASAASSCRGARSSATTSRVFDFRVPGVTTHLGRHAQVRLRLQGHVGARVPRQGAAQRPVLLHDRLDRRQVLLARHRGLALRRPARRDVGGDGEPRPRGLPAATPRQIFETAFAMQDAVRSHPELRIIGTPTFCFSFTSRRVRHLPRQRLHADRAAGASTASSTRTRSTWRSRGRRPSRASPRRSPTDLAEAVAYAHRAQGRARRRAARSTAASPAA